MIKPLTSLRFFFAFIVFLSHIHLFGNTRKSLQAINENYFNEGHLGVSFFFILSGFILAYNYSNSIIIGDFSFKKFYFNRFSRIYPLHLITLILAIPVSLNGFRRETAFWFFNFFANSLLIQSWFPKQTVFWSFNAPSWSISNELFFYLMFPFIILLLTKYRKSYLFFVLPILILPFGVLISNENYWEPIFNINPLIRISDFVLGILLYQIFQKSKEKSIITHSILEVFSLVLIILFYLYRHTIPIGYRYSIYYWIPMGFILLTFSFQKGIISKFISRKIFINLGEISFSFYLIHMVVARNFNFISERISILKNDLILITLIFFISLLLSFISHYYIENRIRVYFKRITQND